jgi:hypothetical protein
MAAYLYKYPVCSQYIRLLSFSLFMYIYLLAACLSAVFCMCMHQCLSARGLKLECLFPISPNAAFRAKYISVSRKSSIHFHFLETRPSYFSFREKFHYKLIAVFLRNKCSCAMCKLCMFSWKFLSC